MSIENPESSIQNRVSSIENPTLAHFRHFIRRGGFSSLFTKFSSTLVENSLQITCFYAKQSQFQKKSNDVNPYNTTDYERKRDWTLGENKPNSNPNKPNLQKAKMNINLTLTKDYRKKDDFEVRINKPNFRNTQNERKRFFTKGL